MTIKEFFEFVEKEMIPDGFDIMKSKGNSYSGLEDKLGNFKRIATTIDLPVEKVWYTYYQKHGDALASYIRGEYQDSEKIKGRILDMINYLWLLAGILKEQDKL